MRQSSLFILLVSMFLMACGGGDGGGGTPAVTLDSITVEPANASIDVGETRQFNAMGHYSDGSSMDITASVTWASSDTTKATIDVAGLVSGVSDGSTSISATDGNISGQTTLTVYAPANLTMITLSVSDMQMRFGSSQQIVATGDYDDGSSRDISQSVSWGVSDASILSVDNSGLAMTQGIGPVTVTATLNSISTQVDLNVLGVISLAKTGQTFCYNTVGATIGCTGTGQDGDLQVGDSTSFRFSSLLPPNDACLRDNLTGLVWVQDADFAPGASWQGALDFIAALNQSGFCGFTDWRLPNAIEFQSLVNYDATDPYAWLQSQGFKNVIGYAWTSNSKPDQAEYAYYLAANGDIFYDSKLGSYGVWPVRGGR